MVYRCVDCVGIYTCRIKEKEDVWGSETKERSV